MYYSFLTVARLGYYETNLVNQVLGSNVIRLPENYTTIPIPMTLTSKLVCFATSLLCCSLAQAKTVFNTCPVTTDSLLCTDLPLRYQFETAQDDQIISLCELSNQETYVLYLNKHNTNLTCIADMLVNSNQATEILVEANNILSFKALGECVDLHLSISPCDAPLPLFLSIHCTSCSDKKDDLEKSVTSIVADENYTATELIEDIFVSGNCFEVIENSIEFTGDDRAKGYFSNGVSSINIEDGVVLSTGRVETIVGPNSFYNSATNLYGAANDPDLEDLLSSNSNLYDLTSLEFDFTPTTDMVSFEFVFASDEYCEYVNSTFNDVFGFFISGPGINGPFTNNAENVALVPGTNDYIAINSVNYLDNSSYYINNVPVWQYNSMPSALDCDGQAQIEGEATQFIEFDGFTSALTAQISLQACETYHIKLAIADVGDAYYDSAVFLKANSFDAGGNADATVMTPDGNTSNVIYEACDEGGFIFTRTDDDLTVPLIVNFSLSPISTATSGLDFQALPTSITIPAGDSVYFLPVNVVTDMIVEGNETIILDLESSCSCEMPFVELQITDLNPLEVLLLGDTLCNAAMVTLTPEVSGGLLGTGYTYLWDSGETTPTISVSPTSTTTYSLTVTDFCGNVSENETEVIITQLPTALISGYEQICPGNTDAFLQIDFTGEGPWDVVYTIDNTAPISITNIIDNPFLVQTNVPGTYLLSTVSTNACEGTVQGAATVVEVSLDIAMNANSVSCPQWDDGSIEVSMSGGFEPYIYVWNDPTLIGNNPTNLAAGNYIVTVTDVFGCTTEASIAVELDPGIPQVEAGTDETLTCTITTLNLSGSASSGADYDYLWSTANGNILAGANTLTPQVNDDGNYLLEITNNLTGCVVSDEVFIAYDTITPISFVNIVGPTTLDCISNTTILDGTGSQPAGSLTYEWTTLNGNINPGDELLPQAEVNTGGDYSLQVTNENNGCSQTTSITIDEETDLPLVDIITPIPLTCIQTQVSLNAGGSSTGADFSYQWSTTNGNIVSGATTLFAEVDEPGIYTLVCFNTTNNCDQSASIIVEQDIAEPIADAGAIPEALDCNTASVLLDGMASSEGAGFTYEWTTVDGNIESGNNTMMPEVDEEGTYILMVTNILNGCTAEDDVLVIENGSSPTDIDFEVTPPLCYDEPGSIAATAVVGGEGPYLFSPDEGENFFADTLFWNLDPGSYPIIVQDANGCEYEELVAIPNASQVTVSLAPDVTISLGDSYELDARANIPPASIDTVIWSPINYLSCIDCMNPEVMPFETTQFEVTLIDTNGCVAENQVLVRVEKSRNVFIPNAFSPNGDGANDRFMIFARSESIKEIKRLELFGRWGEKVFQMNNFQANDPDFGWDGKLNGKNLNNGVFIYYAEIEFIDGFTEIYKGDFTLMR